MNFKTTLVLLVIVVIGAVVLFLVPARETPTEEDQDQALTPVRETKYVFDPQPATNDVVRLELERPGQVRLAFERAPKADQPEQMEPWEMREPLSTPTETYVVDGLVRTFASLQSRSSFKPGAEGAVSAANAGLEPPVATVTFADKDGKGYKLEVGKKAAMSQDTYVRIAGRQTIHIAARDLAQELKKETKDYRAKTLVKLTADDAVGVELEHGGKTYDLSRGEDGEWVINTPVKAYADGEKVRGLVEKLNRVRVDEFIEDEPEALTPYGLDEPFLTMKVTTETKRRLPVEGDEEPATQPAEPQYEIVTNTYGLAVGGFADMKSEYRYVKLLDRPWVVRVSDGTLKDLVPNLPDWRDPRVTRVKAADATRIELTVGADSATLNKVDGRWQGSGDLAELEQPALTNLLEAFEDVNAIDYVDDTEDPAKYGLDAPRAVVKVTTSGAVAPVELKIGANTSSDRNTYVQLAGQPTVMVISAKQADRLAVTPLSLRSREIFSGQPKDIREIDVTRGETHYALAKEGDEWKMSDPPGASPDPASMRELSNDLVRLLAKRVVAKGNDAAFGLAEPAVVVRFKMEEPAPPPPTTTPASQPATTQASQPASAPVLVEHTLHVGRKGKTTYCRKDDDPYIFELDETIYRVLTAELIRRSLFEFKGEEVVGLTIEAPGGTLEFGEADGQWRYLPDLTVELSQKKLKDFAGELAKMRVEAYLAYGDGDLEAAGLADAPVTVTLRLKDAPQVTLKIDQVRRGELPRKAAWVEAGHIFLLRQAEAEKLMRGLDYYAKPEAEDSGRETND
ncbi:MAG TPA: DUF4340 domain-containing protein [Phycisphaerae bacterium]|nr:DUF4340 domain-containing protein [Phycisphaerae bacterium]